MTNEQTTDPVKQRILESIDLKDFTLSTEKSKNEPIAVKPGKELLIDEIKATAAGHKKKGKTLYKALEAARKENADWEKNGVGLAEEDLLTIVNGVYTAQRSSRLDCLNELKMQPPEWLWEGRLSKN